MNKTLHDFVLLMAATFLAVQLTAQNPRAGNSRAPQERKTETFWHKVLRISGISASPSTLKGAGKELESGQVWLAELGSQKRQRLTADAEYRSPIFVPGNNDVLALRGNDVVLLHPSGSDPRRLFSVSGISKLVGFSLDDADKVLTLRTDKDRNISVDLISVSTGKSKPVPYDPVSGEDLRMLEHLRGWDRVYGDKSVYVKRQSKQSLSGPVEWTDVFLKEGANDPVNVSACDEGNCGQPALSSDGKLLVFIKSER